MVLADLHHLFLRPRMNDIWLKTINHYNLIGHIYDPGKCGKRGAKLVAKMRFWPCFNLQPIYHSKIAVQYCMCCFMEMNGFSGTQFLHIFSCIDKRFGHIYNHWIALRRMEMMGCKWKTGHPNSKKKKEENCLLFVLWFPQLLKFLQVPQDIIQIHHIFRCGGERSMQRHHSRPLIASSTQEIGLAVCLPNIWNNPIAPAEFRTNPTECCSQRFLFPSYSSTNWQECLNFKAFKNRKINMPADTYHSSAFELYIFFLRLLQNCPEISLKWIDCCQKLSEGRLVLSFRLFCPHAINFRRIFG